MINAECLHKVKAATVGIGVIKREEEKAEIRITGSGFFVSHTGYVMTASHVLNRYMELVNEKITAQLVAVHLTYLPNGGFNVRGINLSEGKLTKLGTPDEAKNPDISRGINLDIAILKPNQNLSGLPFLTIKRTPKAKLYDDVAMCGYPMGDYSLQFLTEEVFKLRLSPVIQFGRIAGFLPADHADTATAIQTDIIGTAGSSGSPIVDLGTCEVTAIAQKVLPAQVVGNIETDFKAKIGLVYGVHHSQFDDVPERARKHYEENEPFESAITITRYKLE